MKSLLLTAVSTLGLAASTMAQNNCGLISSATFNVAPTTQTVLQGDVLRMTNSTFNQIDTNQWNYIAWVKTSANGGKIYKNGNLVFSGNFDNLSYSYVRLDLGAEYYLSYGGWYNGLIDEVRISSVERSEMDIQNYYNGNQPFISDLNTVGLWHFDENSGSIANGVVGPNGIITNGSWSQGVFGSCLSFNGVNSKTTMNMSIPTSNMTVEFWIKPNGFPQAYDSRPISLGGQNTTTFRLTPTVITSSYTWSTGATGNSVTVDPTQMPYVWVTDGNCTDTIFFNSQSATIYDTTNVTVYDTTNVTVYDTTNVTVYDTLTTYITVTDTLIINANLAGLNPPNNINTLLIYPNPASTHITVDYGNYALMNGYSVRITNLLGQQVFQSPINQQSSFINLSSWTGTGVYHVYLLNPQGSIIDTREIVLQ